VSETALANRQCAVCPQFFMPRSDTARACSPNCAQRLVRADKQARAADRRATRLALLALKPRAKWLREAQAAFNAWVLIRDAGQPCVSCLRHHKGKIDAGHYIAAGDSEALRFEEKNCHAQCMPCNDHKHGNLIRYRAELLRRIGPAEVERLESCCDQKTHSVEELKAIIARYRALIREARK